jgi:hypothetical protein
LLQPDGNAPNGAFGARVPRTEAEESDLDGANSRRLADASQRRMTDPSGRPHGRGASSRRSPGNDDQERSIRALENIEPREVMAFFEELSRRQSGSRHEKQATDYVADFAEKRGLA